MNHGYGAYAYAAAPYAGPVATGVTHELGAAKTSDTPLALLRAYRKPLEPAVSVEQPFVLDDGIVRMLLEPAVESTPAGRLAGAKTFTNDIAANTEQPHAQVSIMALLHPAGTTDSAFHAAVSKQAWPGAAGTSDGADLATGKHVKTGTARTTSQAGWFGYSKHPNLPTTQTTEAPAQRIANKTVTFHRPETIEAALARVARIVKARPPLWVDIPTRLTRGAQVDTTR